MNKTLGRKSWQYNSQGNEGIICDVEAAGQQVAGSCIVKIADSFR